MSHISCPLNKLANWADPSCVWRQWNIAIHLQVRIYRGFEAAFVYPVPNKHIAHGDKSLQPFSIHSSQQSGHRNSFFFSCLLFPKALFNGGHKLCCSVDSADKWSLIHMFDNVPYLEGSVTVALCKLLCFMHIYSIYYGRSQLPRGLRRRSAAALPLRSWVRIPPGA